MFKVQFWQDENVKRNRTALDAEIFYDSYHTVAFSANCEIHIYANHGLS